MHKISLFIKTPEGIALLLLMFGHALAAHFSYGYHHPDEHYQILEFANYWAKATHDSSNLAWEFTAQIRPWFQPLLHGLVMKLAFLTQLYNPFTFTFFARLIYAALNIAALWTLWKEFKQRYALNSIWLIYIALLWFFPYIHVRTSSENLAGIFLSFAFVVYLRNKSLFWVGLLFGFSFLARFQVALGIFGFGLYVLYRDRKITKAPLLLVLGFLIPVGLGVLFDRIGYGDWVFTPYRYFKVNLIDGVAATFNPYPWYQYFVWIGQLNPLVSIPLLFGTILYCVRRKFDAFSAFIVFFFVLHLFITNKEYRFLFPILNLVPFMAAVGFSETFSILNTRLRKPAILYSYVFISLCAFSISSLHGASITTLWDVHAVNDHFEPERMILTNSDYVHQLRTQYYALPPHQYYVIQSTEDLKNHLKMFPNARVIVDGKLEDLYTRNLLQIVQEQNCRVIDSSYPNFLFPYLKDSELFRRVSYKVMFECAIKN